MAIDGIPGLEGKVDMVMPDPGVTETSATIVPESAPPPVEVDLTPQQQIDALTKRLDDGEQALMKSQNDYNAMKGRHDKLASAARSNDDIVDSVAGLSDTVAAVLKHIGRGDDEAFAADLGRVESERLNRKEGTAFERSIEEIRLDVDDALADTGIDLRTDPDLDDFRALWTEAYNQKDIGAMYRAQAELFRVLRRHARAAQRQLQDATDSEKERIRRSALEEAGVNDIDGGNGAASGELSADALFSRDVNSVPFGDLQKHKDQLIRAMRR